MTEQMNENLSGLFKKIIPDSAKRQTPEQDRVDRARVVADASRSRSHADVEERNRRLFNAESAKSSIKGKKI